MVLDGIMLGTRRVMLRFEVRQDKSTGIVLVDFAMEVRDEIL
jgi:hypothetical protein